MTNPTDPLNEQLFQELDDKVAQNCNGGYEVFTIENQTRYRVGYSIDRRNTRLPSGKQQTWTAYKGGTISFDRDGRNSFSSFKKFNLADGGVYAFRYNKSTRGNPYDINLYKIG